MNENAEDNTQPWYGDELQLRHILQADCQFTNPSDVDEMLNLIKPLHKTLRPHFVHWMKRGQLPNNLEIEGFTAESIQELQPTFSHSGIFDAFNRLIQNPSEMRQVLLYRWPAVIADKHQPNETVQ